MIDVLRPVRNWLRDTRDAVMFERRRRRAQKRLRALRPERIVFVCLGNICRSPFAERWLAATSERALIVESAGFIGPGRPPPPEALSAARRHDIDHSDHRSRVVDPETIGQADVVFVFDRGNEKRLRDAFPRLKDRVIWLGDLDLRWTGRRPIVDPWGKDQRDFDEAFARIARCVDEVDRLIGA